MVAIKVNPSCLKGVLALPFSKSHTMRAIMLGSLSYTPSYIYNYLDGSDTHSMIQAMRQLGAEITCESNYLKVSKIKESQPCRIDAGNSGQILRFVTAIAALTPHRIEITGDHSIQTLRPIAPLLDGLAQLNVSTTSTQGFAPCTIQGPLKAGIATVQGADSQVVSALLMATTYAQGASVLHVINPGETPWVELTLHWLRFLGACITHDNYHTYRIQGNLQHEGFTYKVPGDLSAAAFGLVAAIITRSVITLKHVDLNDVQGDKKVVEILRTLGANLEYDQAHHTLKIEGTKVTGFNVDLNDTIDLVPIFAVLGCYTTHTSKLYNVAISRCKESDRLSVITQQLRLMGACIQENVDGLVIEPTLLHGATLHSHQDHRIAMSLIVAALAATTPSIIEGVECICKSYPHFIEDFQSIGADITLI